MKRAAKALKDPRLGDRFPECLQEAVATKAGEGSSHPEKGKQSRAAVFQPTWGICRKDSIMGDTKLARDWSLQSIPPVDYKDFVLEKYLEGIELLGSQTHAAISIPTILFSAIEIIYPFYDFNSNALP